MPFSSSNIRNYGDNPMKKKNKKNTKKTTKKNTKKTTKKVY